MKIVNRSAWHDYTILETIEAGIKLTGPEVKSVKAGHASLKGSYVRIIGSEAYLVNAQIQPYAFARLVNYDPTRTRKLLLQKQQIISLKTKTERQRITLIPVNLYISHGIIKLEIGLAKSKKQYDKREALKRRDLEREMEREYRGKLKL